MFLTFFLSLRTLLRENFKCWAHMVDEMRGGNDTFEFH